MSICGYVAKYMCYKEQLYYLKLFFFFDDLSGVNMERHMKARDLLYSLDLEEGSQKGPCEKDIGLARQTGSWGSEDSWATALLWVGVEYRAISMRICHWRV